MKKCLHYDCEHRNSFGYCRFTTCINPKYGFLYTTSTENQTEEYIIKQPTNGDKIRTKNNHDLAEWLAQIMDCCWNAARYGECDEDCPMYNCCNNQLSDNIEDWLNQEAQDGNKY